MGLSGVVGGVAGNGGVSGGVVVGAGVSAAPAGLAIANSSGMGGRSSPSVSGVAAPSPSPSHSHSSPYDLRRKSPPHPDPAPGTSSAMPPGGSNIASTFGSSSLPARKRVRRSCSLSTDGNHQLFIVHPNFHSFPFSAFNGT